jgi:hypothetical protein
LLRFSSRFKPKDGLVQTECSGHQPTIVLVLPGLNRGYDSQMLATLVWTLLVAGEPAAKLDPSVGKEMTTAIVAVNKALGLETWDARGEKPCVDRGGLEAMAKDVGPEETRECASTAIAKGFPSLGQDYVLGIPMAGIGPVTVFAVGIGDSDGWGAYSCDPTRKCSPTKLSAASKQAKRLADRYRRACLDPKTVWFPDRQRVCADAPMNAVADPIPEPKTPKVPPPAAKGLPAAAKPSSGEPPAREPWPVKE